jgi:hypothetical protein
MPPYCRNKLMQTLISDTETEKKEKKKKKEKKANWEAAQLHNAPGLKTGRS